MGLISRLSFVVRSKLNSIVSKAEEETTDESLDYAHEQMQDQIADLRQVIRDVTTERKRLETKRDELNEQIEKDNANAREAVSEDNETLARKFLSRKKENMATLQDYAEQIDELKLKQEELEQTVEKLENRREEFGTEKELLKARGKAAEAEVNVKEVLSGSGTNSIQDRIASVEDSIETNEARSDALDELADDGVLESNTDDALDELDDLQTDAEIESELEMLRDEVDQ